MKSSLRGYKLYVVAIALLFLNACSSTSGPVHLYEGAKQSDSEVVKLIVPAALDVIELDGKEFKDSPSISEGQYQLELLPGSHALKVVYSQVWGGDALGSMVKSDDFYFMIDAMAGSIYEFKHNGPEELLSAEFDRSINDIKIWLEEQKTGNKIETISVHAYNGLLYGSVAGNDGAGTSKAAAKKDVSQAQQKELNQVKQKASKQLEFWWKIANVEQRTAFQRWLVTLKEATGGKASDSMQQKAAEQLKFWWKLADVKQRESFLLWIKK